MFENEFAHKNLLDFVIVEAKLLQVLESVERRSPDVVDLSLRNPQIDQSRHPVEDSGRHKVDPALLDCQYLQLGQGLETWRDSRQPAVGDVQLLERLSYQTVKGAVAYVLKNDCKMFSPFTFTLYFSFFLNKV